MLDFAALMIGLNPKDGNELRTAALRIQETFFGIVPSSEKNAEVESPEPRNAESAHDSSKPVKINAPLDFTLKGLDPAHPYLLGRKFTPETIHHFGLGFCKRGFLAHRAAIPLHDDKGNLIGYAGRLVDDNAIDKEHPKYLFPGTREKDGVTHEFRKSEFLYNGHRIKGPVDNLVTVEGFASVWRLTQAGFRDVVALMGSDLGDKQADLILSLLGADGCLWIFTDGDEAGERCAGDLFRRIAPHRLVRRVPLASDRQPTELSAEELAAALPFKDRPRPRSDGRQMRLRLLTKEITRRQAIVELAQSFPTLRERGLTTKTWEPDAFDEMATQFQGSERHAARFILEVWRQERDWKAGRFSVTEAMSLWDTSHRTAFLSWVSDSW
ncbi:MAG: toprim domain-containing protein [Verrucomicrobia bacterium]|nr:toprim domain-containing protein [Verrucomicrobiota bacterium]